ncbi:hypothetical protein AAC387_Pa10g1913 [Persea americana]
MGVEKHGSKVGGAGYVGGFLQLFDWNGKSRKKLSYNKFDLPEGTKQGKKSDENLPLTRFRLTEEDDNGGISSVKGSSNHSCVSSSTDDEGNGIRAPGVVARLMGLDSLPTTTAAEPYATPFFEPQSFRDAHYQRKMSEYHEYQSGIADNQLNRVDGSRPRIAESRPQKVPNSPIERFQCETLPPKSAKSHPIAHHKLLSPIKSSGFISPKNAADIMEAAVKILEPGYPTGSKGKSLPLVSSSVPTKPHDLKERSTSLQRPSRLSETSKRPAEPNAVRLLKGQSMNKSWNGSDDTPDYRTSPQSEGTQSVGSRNKGKSVSLAIQAKVNVQRREGLGSGSRSSLVRKEEDEHKSSHSLKNQPTASKSRQNKSSTSSASGVLRQNNQKQNCPSNKDKLPLKPSVSNQQGRKAVSGDGSFGRSKTFNKISGSSRVGKKEGSEVADERKIPSSRTKNFPRKKRAINGDFYSEKSGFIDTVSVNRDDKSAQPHAAVNEHNRAEDSRRKGMDVISFTFTSPMIKPTTVSRSSDQMEKQNTTNVCFVDSIADQTSAAAGGKRLSSLGLNVIGGDALSILLEKKLRELTFGMESSSCFNPSKTEIHATSTPTVQNFASALTTMSAIPRESSKAPLLGHEKDEVVDGFNSGCSLINGRVFEVNHKFQGVEAMAECSSNSNDARKELDCQHPSPISIFEASFSNGSCNSSESWEGTNGNKMCPSGQAQNLYGLLHPMKILSVEAETELSDSASSTFTGTVDTEHVEGLGESGQMRTEEEELEYVKVIIQNASLIFKDLASSHAHEVIGPHLFERLENQEIKFRNECDSQDSKLSRRELFDCVSEFLSMKCSHYVRGGYRTWAQGVAVVQKEGLAVEIFKEILLWRTMGDWMVDDLVEKDMSSHLGRWLDFEAEAFETGVEIEGQILCSLVDEVVADLLL